MPRVLLFAALLASSVVLAAQRPAPPGPAVVLVTFDGARIEEIFGGLDAEIVRSQMRGGDRLEDQALYKRFWARTPEARRAKLMPFFWGTLMRDYGSIAGNPARGSRVHLTNTHAFSYPGYAEMLLGRAHDDAINSNAPTRNPFPTVLEFLKRRMNLTTPQAAVFTSWSVFNAIVEHTPRHADGQLRLHRLRIAERRHPPAERAAIRDADAVDRGAARRLHVPVRDGSPRATTPRVLYLGLGETDDWAHDGRYDRVLEAFARSDEYLKQLWTWLQSQHALSRPHAPADHDRPRPRPHNQRVEKPRQGCRGGRRDVDGVRVAVDEPPRRMERRARDRHRAGRGDAD